MHTHFMAKPTMPVLDLGHQLSRGLVSAWVMGEQSQKTPVRAYGPYSGIDATCTNFTTSGRINTPYGAGILQNADGGYVAAPASPLYYPLEDCMTYAILAKFNNAAANFGPISTCQSGNYGWNFYFNGTARTFRFTIGFGTSNFNYTKTGSPQIQDGQWYMIGFAYNGTNLDAHYDGLYYNFNTNAGRPVPSAIPLRIIQANLNGEVAGAWLWRRYLQPDELKSFCFDPWQMLRPRSQVFQSQAASSSVLQQYFMQSGVFN